MILPSQVSSGARLHLNIKGLLGIYDEKDPTIYYDYGNIG